MTDDEKAKACADAFGPLAEMKHKTSDSSPCFDPGCVCCQSWKFLPENDKVRAAETAAAVEALEKIEFDESLLEVGGAEIEKTLIEFRDSRLSEMGRGNGLVVREKDGSPSQTIRFGPETALRIGLKAIRAEIKRRKEDAEMIFDHVWYWRSHLPERKGQRCRVLKQGGMNSILVEFEDGKRVVASRYAVRRIPA